MTNSLMFCEGEKEMTYSETCSRKSRGVIRNDDDRKVRPWNKPLKGYLITETICISNGK